MPNPGGRAVKLSEIAARVGGRLTGDGCTAITGVAGIREAKSGDITFLANRRYASLLAETKASAVIISETDDLPQAIPAVIVKNPDLAFAITVESFAPSRVDIPREIHPTARIAKGVRMGKRVAVGAYAVVEEGASIGDDTTIYPFVYVGHKVSIGKGSLLYAHVVLRERVEVGNNVIIHGGAVIGSDGFGFAQENGAHQKIPQIGTVVIEDDVEIGANTTIDRARLDKTVLKKGVKIDNLVQIGHNVVVGDHTVIAAQTGIAGSARLGRQIMVGGQAGIGGHVEVGDRVMIAGQAGVTKSVPPGAAVSGTPAAPHHKTKREWASLRRLPEMHALLKGLKNRIGALEERIEELEEKSKND